jgi:glycosyltransferase involved in cell wall biosynthesis
MSPKVSVIIPTYNRATKVCNAIDSVLSQTFSDLEVIVVDDGSSDQTDAVLQERYGDRIRCLTQPNQGASAARNTGMAAAHGEWIAFLDSDDLWEPEKLAWQIKAVEGFGNRCGVCYTDTRFFNYPETRTMFELASDSYHHAEKIGVNDDVLRVLVNPGGAGMVVCTCTLLVRSDLIAKSGGFDTNLSFGEDSELMFRLATLTDYCYVNLPLVAVDRAPAEVRHVGVSSEWNKLEVILRDAQLKFEKYSRAGAAVPPKIQVLIRQGLGTIHSGWVNWYLETGQYGRARESALKALRMNFQFNLAMKWLLTWISPRLALRAVKRHQSRKKDLVPFI